MSTMGKLNGRHVMIKKYQRTTTEHEISQLFRGELNTIRYVANMMKLIFKTPRKNKLHVHGSSAYTKA